MDDLINRQRLLKELKHHKELFCRNRIEFLGLSKNDKARVDEIDNCYAMVINAPSAQPEIIRCGECKWFQCNMRMDGYLPKGVDEFECRHWCGSCDPVDFCSYAERRTDEQTV